MTKSVPQPTTLLEAVRYFSDDELAFNFVKELRWPDGEPACPRCGALDPYFLSTRRVWKCKGCKKQFSLKVGTIFEDSALGWDKWLPCVWLIANSKNSISSYEVARSLGVTQKTAWFMLQRIRLAMKSGTFSMKGTTEVDETYVGGVMRNVHKRVLQVRGPLKKQVVQGARNRETGQVQARHIDDKNTLKQNVYNWIVPGTTLYTDEAIAYRLMGERYDHHYVTHTGGPVATRYVKGDVHTNGIENFWSILKRTIKGTHIHVSAGHLHRYVAERQFAYNLRDESDLSRMVSVMVGSAGKRLTYRALTHGRS